ncbi:hypothetical protein EDD85DRAFT_776953, partial [Armillaria nabsnona]
LPGNLVMVVGVDIGLEFEALKHFVGMNPERLILACRNEEKGKEALFPESKDKDYSNAELWITELANFGSVMAFADKCTCELHRLDILVENVGMSPRIVIVASGVHYWIMFEKGLVESPNILAKLSNKEYYTLE